ncbi:MAG TPA: TonB family protein [Allosphingosinicella sp.]
MEKDAGVSEPRPGRRIGGIVAALLFFGLIFFLFSFADLFPTGVPVAKPWAESKLESQAGLLTIPDAGLDLMTFSPERGLRANLESGRWTDIELCAHATPEVLSQIEEAARSVERGRHAGRALWVEIVAERRFGASPCRQRDAEAGVTALGPLVRIVSITRARPLDCDPLLFLSKRLRCPEPPRRGPSVISDTEGQLYPEAALLARKQGRTSVRMLADSQDSVLSCEIVESSGDSSLDSATCDLFRKRPHLIPKEGRTEGYATGVREVTQAITWRLPD